MPPQLPTFHSDLIHIHICTKSIIRPNVHTSNETLSSKSMQRKTSLINRVRNMFYLALQAWPMAIMDSTGTPGRKYVPLLRPTWLSWVSLRFCQNLYFHIYSSKLRGSESSQELGSVGDRSQGDRFACHARYHNPIRPNGPAFAELMQYIEDILCTNSSKSTKQF